MLVVVSPAKRLDLTPVDRVGATLPVFQDDAAKLARNMRRLSRGQLQKLMRLSDSLVELNAKRFAEFSQDPEVEQAKPAVLIFAGDTYVGLDAASLDDAAMEWAQDHLRILSGLYGLLRPRDLIQPYRLEMGSRLKTRRGASLYAYWGARLAKALNDEEEDTLVNCASVEYFKAVEPNALKLRVITPQFMEMSATGPRIIGFFAKKARGAMARFIIDQRISDPEGLKDFDRGGYRFNAEMTAGDHWVFLRDSTERPSDETA